MAVVVVGLVVVGVVVVVIVVAVVAVVDIEDASSLGAGPGACVGVDPGACVGVNPGSGVGLGAGVAPDAGVGVDPSATGTGVELGWGTAEVEAGPCPLVTEELDGLVVTVELLVMDVISTGTSVDVTIFFVVDVDDGADAADV